MYSQRHINHKPIHFLIEKLSKFNKKLVKDVTLVTKKPPLKNSGLKKIIWLMVALNCKMQVQYNKIK